MTFDENVSQLQLDWVKSSCINSAAYIEAYAISLRLNGEVRTNFISICKTLIKEKSLRKTKSK